MGIQVVWDNEARKIIRWDIQGVWRSPEIYPAMRKSFQMADSFDREFAIDVIVNFLEAAAAPLDFIGPFTEAVITRIDRNYIIVLVGANDFEQTAAETLKKIYDFGHEVLFADSVDAARALIQQQRGS